MPTGVDVDMKAMAEGAKLAIPAGAKLRGMQIQDIAYGLKALLLSVVMEDAGGISDKVEEALRGVPNVENVEVLDTSLI
jgi:elongation factor 1-beta